MAPGVTKEEALRGLETAAKGILPAGYSFDYAKGSHQMRSESSSLVSTLGLASSPHLPRPGGTVQQLP